MVRAAASPSRQAWAVGAETVWCTVQTVGVGGGIPRGDGIKDKHGGDDSLDAVKEADRGSSLPYHVAIIMDGNRRFAASKRMPTVYGHKKGKEVLEKVMHTRPTPRQNL